MAKLKPIEFNQVAKTGEKLSFRSEVTVSDTSGAFALTIPDELETGARRLSRLPEYRVSVDRPRTHLRVEGSTLQHCKDFIVAVIKDYLQCEVTEELVLVYRTNIKVTYVKDDDGNIYPNGAVCREKYDNGTAKWHGSLHATQRADYYQVGMTARVFKKITYTRPSGETVEYQWVNGASSDQGAWASKLNGLVGLEWNYRDAVRMGYLDQLPYTEEAAEFFYNLMMSMCALADRVTNFMGDKNRVLAAIQNRAGLLPAPAKEQV